MVDVFFVSAASASFHLLLQESEETAPATSGGPTFENPPDEHGTVFPPFVPFSAAEEGEASQNAEEGRPLLPAGVAWADQDPIAAEMDVAIGQDDIVVKFEGDVINSNATLAAETAKADRMGIDPEVYQAYRAAIRNNNVGERLLGLYALNAFLSIPGVVLGQFVLPAYGFGWLSSAVITTSADIAWESGFRASVGLQPMTPREMSMSALGNTGLPRLSNVRPLPKAPSAPSVPKGAPRTPDGIDSAPPPPRPRPSEANSGQMLTTNEVRRVQTYQRLPGKGAELEGVHRSSAGPRQVEAKVTKTDASGKATEIEFDLPNPDGGRIKIRQKLDAPSGSQWASGRVVEVEVRNVNAKQKMERDRSIARASKDFLDVGPDLSHTQGLSNRGVDAPYNFEHASPHYNQTIRTRAESRVAHYLDTHPDVPTTLIIRRKFTASGALKEERFTLVPVGGGKPKVDITVSTRGKVTDHLDPARSTQIRKPEKD